MSGARGGHKPKIAPRTEGGWVADELVRQKAFEESTAQFTKEALKSVKAPDAAFNRAFTIMRTYRRQLEELDQPRISKDKNGQGIGKFAGQLGTRSQKMADYLGKALADERSHDLDGLIDGHDLRSFMSGAYDALSDVACLISRMGEGEVQPMSAAEIRNEAGGKLKALARKYELPLINFVKAFDIYPTKNAHESSAFNKWFYRLSG
jgi:hypothetical protein